VKKVVIILSVVFIQVTGFCQKENINLSGIVKDSADNSPIANTSIKLIKTNLATQSDNKGEFFISISQLPVLILFTHLGYYDSLVNFSDTFKKCIEIKLRKKVGVLPVLTVTTPKAVSITKDQPLYIKDYEFSDSNIIVFAYRDFMLSKACICLLNLNGDTICSVRLKSSGNLYKDCLGFNHLLNKSIAWQIFSDSGIVNFIYPTDIEKFEEAFKPLVAELNNKFFYQKYYCNNQLLQYYYYDKISNITEELKVISNKENLFMLRDKARIVMGSDDPEIQERFENLAFYKPVFAPLVKIHDTICIFNYADSVIEFYSDSCKLFRQLAISFHNNRFWKREIYVDDAKGKVYALFRKNGISTLKEIDLKTGQLKNSIVIPEFPFVEKIKVYNDNVFFLYSERGEQSDYKRLYKMKI
jgi:hypothetical protein